MAVIERNLETSPSCGQMIQRGWNGMTHAGLGMAQRASSAVGSTASRFLQGVSEFDKEVTDPFATLVADRIVLPSSKHLYRAFVSILSNGAGIFDPAWKKQVEEVCYDPLSTESINTLSKKVRDYTAQFMNKKPSETPIFKAVYNPTLSLLQNVHESADEMVETTNVAIEARNALSSAPEHSIHKIGYFILHTAWRWTSSIYSMVARVVLDIAQFNLLLLGKLFQTLGYSNAKDWTDGKVTQYHERKNMITKRAEQIAKGMIEAYESDKRTEGFKETAENLVRQVTKIGIKYLTYWQLPNYLIGSIL